MKIVFLITSLGYGGAEIQLVHVATRLKARGWQVKVVSLLPPHAYVEELSEAEIPVCCLGMRRGVPDPRALLRLVRILRRERPKVLHSHMVHANLLARLARPLAWVPVLVCTAHSIDEGGRRRQWAYRVTDFFCNLTTQVSKAGLERYVRIRAVPRKRLQFVPNGVDTSRFRPDPEARSRLRAELGLGDSFAWLAVGRFEEAKDYPNMLRAFARVAQSGGRTVLLIAGQGPLQEMTEHMAEDLGIDSRVLFLGLRRDVQDLMNAADAYVMSSAWEGTPMVLLEASATGLPAVATDVGGNREVVLEEETGFLVPPRDPEALSRAMAHLMALSPGELNRLGLRARDHVAQHYDIEYIVDTWESLYKTLFDSAE